MKMKLRLFILSALMCTLLERLPCLGEGVVTMEKTFAMVKPDGMMGNHSEEIKRIILATGFVIATEKIVQLDEAAVRIFYAEHSQREFFPSLTRFMTSGPVLAMVLEKEDAVAQWRSLIGPTDARKARVSHPKSIRAICGLDSEKNCVHGSDSHQSATREIAFFFGDHMSGRHLDDTWTASITDNLAEGVRWRQVGCGIPSGRFGQSCTVVGDLLVLFGGINDKGVRQNDTWIGQILHDETSNGRFSWKLLEVAAAPACRGAHAGCFAGDKRIMVYGGIRPDGIRLNDTWMLDLSEGRQPCWHEVETPLSPPARSGHTLTWIGGNRIVLFGGRGTHFEVLNDVWMFDMDGSYPEWVELCANVPNPLDGIPTPRSGHSATMVFGGRVLIYGGEDASRSRKGDIWVLDPAAGYTDDTRSSYTSSPVIRVPDVTANASSCKMWKKLRQKGHIPKNRSFHGACAIESGRSILVFGGMVDGEVLPASSFALGFDAELYLLELVP